MSLYTMTQDLIELDDKFDDPATESLIELTEADIVVKLESYGKFIRNLESRRDAKKEESRRLQSEATIDDNKITRLKNNIKCCMLMLGCKRVDAGLFTFTVANNGGKTPLVIEVEPETLPESLRKVSVSANNDAIREWLEAGNSVAGCRIGERGTSLRIK